MTPQQTPATEGDAAADKRLQKLQLNQLKKLRLPDGKPVQIPKADQLATTSTTPDAAGNLCSAASTTSEYRFCLRPDNRPMNLDDFRSTAKGSSSTTDASITNGFKEIPVWPPIPWTPSWCLDLKANTGYWGTRQAQCALSTWWLVAQNARTGAVIGQVHIADITYVYLSPRHNSFVFRYAQGSSDPEGVFLELPGFLSFSPSFNCYSWTRGRACSTSGSNSPTIFRPGVPMSYEATGKLSNKKGVKGRFQGRFEFSYWAFPNYVIPNVPVVPHAFSVPVSPTASPTGSSPTANIRCDNLSNPQGCTNAWVEPYFNINLNRARSSQWADHIWWTQTHKKDHFGWKDHGPALQFLKDKKLQDKNRRITCPPPNAKEKELIKKGKSCDEYPFASSFQGGYFVGAGRTDKRYINARHNSSGGGLTNSFYRANRILNKDKLWVWIYDGPAQP